MRHLTKRAIEVLCGRTDDLAPTWIVACSGESGLEMDLGGIGEVVTSYGVSTRGLCATTIPTCPRCAVLLDEALEKGRT